MRLLLLLAGAAAGAVSGFYFASYYQPVLLNGTIHAVIFGSGLVALFIARRLTVRKATWYIAGALPVHLLIHFVVIRDLAQLVGVSHILLNFESLP